MIRMAHVFLGTWILTVVTLALLLTVTITVLTLCMMGWPIDIVYTFGPFEHAMRCGPP